MGAVEIFGDVGVIAAEDGVLHDALAELAVRLDLAGCGELLTEIVDLTCWQVSHGPLVPGCRCEKGTPNPKPTPPPPPKPQPPRDPK